MPLIAGAVLWDRGHAEEGRAVSRAHRLPNKAHGQWEARRAKVGPYKCGPEPSEWVEPGGAIPDGPWRGGWWVPRFTPGCSGMDATVLPAADPAGLTITLRDYQAAALDAWRVAGGVGTVVAPCGSGKTSLGMGAISAVDTPCLVLVHTLDLARQWMERAHEQLEGVTVGLVGAGKKQDEARVVVATLQTLARWSWVERNRWGKRFGLVIQDECFPAGTQVLMACGKTKNIEDVITGDSVVSFNEETGETENRAVTATMTRTHDAVCVILLEDGTEVSATENHPFMTSRGWLRAGSIKEGTEVLVDVKALQNNMRRMRKGNREASEEPEPKPTLRRVHREAPAGAEKETRDEVLMVRGGSRRHREERAGARAPESGVPRTRLLRRVVPEDGEDEKVLPEPFERKQEARVCSDEGEQPDAQQEEPGEDGKDASQDRPRSACSRRERDRDDGAAEDPHGSPWGGMARGACRQDREWEPVAKTLQDRLCEPGEHDRGRGGRVLSRVAEKAGRGQEEGRVFEWRRVASVSLQESRGPGGSGARAVYNLEVENTHTYIANGFVVHNCHIAPAASFAEVLSSLPGRHRLGLTATPERMDGLGAWVYWSCGAEVYRIEEALLEDAGCTLAPLIRWLRTGWEPPRGVDSWTDVVNATVSSERRNGLILEEVASQIERGRISLVLSDRVGHCHELVEAIEERHGEGTAAALVGAVAKGKRAQILEDARSGRLRVVTATSVADEGLDVPSLETVILTCPSRNLGRVQQRIGRALRPAEDKGRPEVVDMVDDYGAAMGYQKKRAGLYRRLGWV